jgi:hypothetical protein
MRTIRLVLALVTHVKDDSDLIHRHCPRVCGIVSRHHCPAI